MAIVTTNIAVTTAVTVFLSSATTWANTKGCSLTDPIYLRVRNSGATPVRIGSVLSTVAGVGYPITTLTTFEYMIRTGGETLSIVTSASTSNIDVLADRQ